MRCQVLPSAESGLGKPSVTLPKAAAAAGHGCRSRALTAVLLLGKPMIRYGVQHLLQRAGFDGEVVIGHNADAARRALEAGGADLLVVDTEGLRALETAPDVVGATKTVVITPQQHFPRKPTGPGQVCGMLGEDFSEEQLLALLGSVLGCLSEQLEAVGCAACDLHKTLNPARLPLSPREMDIFVRIGQGIGPMRIGAELGLSVKTVESYRDKIKQKLQLHSRDALLLAAVQWRRGFYIDRSTAELAAD